MDRRRLEAFQTVASKSHRVLTFVLIALILLASRIWYLCIYDNENRSAESKRGRYRQEMVSANRGTVQDRFSIPLAVNRIEYRISIVWADIAEAVPRRVRIQPNSAKKWRFARKEYIKALSHMISKIVPSISSKRIEDLIYSYAVYSNTIPVTIKAGLTEEEYGKLAAKATSWPGLRPEIGSKRFYPHEKSLCHVIGYTAAIQKEEYDAVLSLRERLQKAIARYELDNSELEDEERGDPLSLIPYHILKKRLSIVERKLYSLRDSVGRAGVESSFESALRGLSGKRSYETNARGDFLREASDSKLSSPGKRVCLTISLELQKKCEELLVQSESDRSRWLMAETKRIQEGAMNPLVRGGSIVVLDANNGDILALASAPRYNLNDFSSQNSAPIPESIQGRLKSKKSRGKRDSWLQNRAWLGSIWDGITALEKEVWNDVTEEIEEVKEPLTWRRLLSISFPAHSRIHEILSPKRALYDLIMMQKDFFELKNALNMAPLDVAKNLIEQRSNSHKGTRLSKEFHSIEIPQEIVAGLDVSRLLIRHEEIEKSLEKFTKGISVGHFRTMCQTILRSKEFLKDIFHAMYQEGPFKEWREQNEIEFLKEKREEEKRAKKVNQPYIIYLDKECELQFKLWWNRNSDRIFTLWSALISSQIEISEISNLWEKYILHGIKQWMLHQHSSSIASKNRIEKTILFSQFFSRLPLENRYAILRLITPFTELAKYPLEGTYSSIRRFGRPKSLQDILQVVSNMSSPNIQSLGYMLATPPGSVFKLITASALLRNEETQSRELHSQFFQFQDRFFRIGEKPYVGISSRGEPIPQIYKGGRIPKSLTTAIGLVDLVRAIEYSSNPYFSLGAAECLPSPKLLEDEARLFGFGEKTGLQLPGEAKGAVPSDLITNKTALYTTAIGQHTLLATPVQIATMLATYASKGTRFIPRVVSTVIGLAPKIDAAEEQLYGTMLRRIGISAPIWVSSRKEQNRPRIWVMPNETKPSVEISSPHRNLIFQGMQKVTAKMSKDAFSLRKIKRDRPELYEAFQRQREQMLAKTSTAESYERLGLPYGNSPFMYSHTGIGTLFTKHPITLQNSSSEIHPDIAVVVSLPYGSYGKEAGPIAAKVVDEWRKISQKKRSLGGE
ncbi:MAG: penicillin-binding transpeptidase domain-containing protein [Chlamydia sp.]